jgi:hypothetical protein
VYQTEAAPAAIIRPPSETTAPIGGPVTGRALPALTPPPGLLVVGAGVAVVGLTPPGGTVSVLPVGVVVGGAVVGLTLP